MNFFKKIKDSVYSPKFYSEAIKGSFGSAMGFFLLFTLLLSIVQTLFLSKTILVNIPDEAKKFLSQSVELYPKELQVKIVKGQVVTNVKEPYFLKSDDGKNFLVIDTVTPFSAAKFNEYHVVGWVSKDAIFYKSSTGTAEIKTVDLSQIPDTTLNRNIVSEMVSTVSSYVKYLGPSLFVLAFLLFYSLYTGRLFYLLFFSLLVLVVGKILKRNLSYGQSYKVGLYAITLGMTVDLIRSLLNWGGFPFMFTLISLVVVIVNLKNSKE